MKPFSFLTLGAAVLGLAFAPARAATRADYVQTLNNCQTALQVMQARASTTIPPSILQRAHAIAIIHQVKAGFIFGIKGGSGVLLVKKTSGSWSLPGFLSSGDVSFGLQAGAKTIDTVFIFLDDQSPRLLLQGKVDFGADAKAVAGPHVVGNGNDEFVKNASVLVYTSAEGLFAGASVNTGYLWPNNKANRDFYATDNNMPEIIYSDWITPPPEVQPLMNYIARLTSGGQ